MKNKTISGIALVILGALISIAPAFLISQNCLAAKMRCFGTTKAELGVGILIVLLALFFIYFEAKGIQMGISLSLAFIGIFSALLPTVLIGVCNGSCNLKCSCSPASSIIMAILGVAVLLISLMNLKQLNKPHKKQ